MSALEARVAQLEEANEAMKREGDEAKALIAALQAEVATLAAAGVATQTAEPEVEIELIVEEIEGDNEENTEIEFTEESDEESQEESLEPLEILEPLEVLDKLEIEETEIEEAVIETPAVEPVVEVKVEPTPAPKPAPRPMPQQTSLFGSAVEDIRQAISLGDRFLFQRELFAGNGELMQKTLDELNALGSLEEAMDYVADNFEWDSDSTAVQLFENVLKRRFA